MNSKISRLLLQSRRGFKCQMCRPITTISDPRKSSGPLPRERNEAMVSGMIQKSVYTSEKTPETDVISFMFKDMNKWQNKICTECGITGRKLTFSQTFDGALRWGAALKKLLPGIKNPTVAFISVNSPEFVTMFVGTIAAGGVVTPMNPAYTPEEVAYQIKNSGAHMIVVDTFLEPLSDVVLKLIKKDLPVVVTGPTNSQSGRPNAYHIIMDTKAPMVDPSDVDPKQIAMLPYSSGTTGRPKGVKHTHESIVKSICMWATEEMSEARKAEGNHQDLQLGILPYFHIFGLMSTMVCGLKYGIRTITVPKFDPKTFTSIIKKNKLTFFQGVPLLLQFISENPAITKEDIQHIRASMFGASPLPCEVYKSLKTKMSPSSIIQQGYGMTESMVVHITPRAEERMGSCGKLLPNAQAKIVDVETGELLPANTPGELYLHTPAVMDGYHNNEAATKEILDEEGWLQTGDMAMYSEDGFYYIVERIKDLIKVKGLQVSPTEVEETIELLPGVSEAGVVAVPHPKYGEAPLAYIVKSDQNITEEDIHLHMKEHLSHHKQLLGGITFVKELPRNQTGKLLRRILKDMTKNK